MKIFHIRLGLKYMILGIINLKILLKRVEVHAACVLDFHSVAKWPSSSTSKTFSRTSVFILDPTVPELDSCSTAAFFAEILQRMNYLKLNKSIDSRLFRNPNGRRGESFWSDA